MGEKISRWKPTCDSWESAPLHLHAPMTGRSRPYFVSPEVKRRHEARVRAIMKDFDEMADVSPTPPSSYHSAAMRSSDDA